jgi:hypothetical protein
MLDRMLSIGRAFDWISPTIGMIMNVARGPSHQIMVPQACGRTGGEITRLLRRHGIATWGHMIVHGTFMIRVKTKQARWAEYVLTRAGIPLGYGNRDGMVVYDIPSVPAHEDRQTKRNDRQAGGGLIDTLRELGDLRLF